MNIKIKNFFNFYKTEILIFSFCFVVRFLYSLLLQYKFGSHAFISYLDAAVFLREAKNIVDHGVISQFLELPFLPDPLRTPIYLWFLASLLWLKLPLLGMVTLQNILAGFIGLMTYQIGKIGLKSEIAGITAAILYGIEPSSIYWNNLLMSDNLFAFFLILSVYLLIRNNFYWAAAGMGIATLTRPLGLYLYPLFLVIVAINYFHASYDGIRDRISQSGILPLIKRLSIMSALFLMIIFPWMLRNKILFNHWDLSTAGWLNLYIFTVKEFAVTKNIMMTMPVVPDDYHPGAWKEVFYNYEFSSADFYKRNTFDLISKFPLDYFKFHIFSGLKSFGNHDYRYLLDHVLRAESSQFSGRIFDYAVIIGEWLWAAIYAGALLGFLKFGARNWQLFFLVLVLINNILIGYNGLISSGGRYNMPFLPLVLLMGSYGLLASYNWICARLTASTLRTKI